MKKPGRKRKLTREDVQEIQRMYEIRDVPWSVPQLARTFDVSITTIHKALNGTLKASDDVD